MFSKPRVAVLRGGPSNEYNASLRTGATVLSSTPDRYHALDVFIDRDGVWHLHGKREPPEKVLGRVDVVWNALHGDYGEDGVVQHILESHGVPFSGPRRLAAAVSQNKSLAKKIVRQAGIKTPEYRVLRFKVGHSLSALARELFRAFPQPSVIKPAWGGSSIGVFVAQTADELLEALTRAFSLSPTVLLEEYIDGREAVSGVIEHFRSEALYPLIPVEVEPPQGRRFLDEEVRYGSDVRLHSPGRFTDDEKHELQVLAQHIHRHFGLTHYSSSDFIVSPRRGIFFIETDALPYLGEGNSPYLLSLKALGITPGQFIGHVLSLIS